MTGTETGRLLSSSAPPRTLPRVPSMTLGVKPRRLLPLPPAESSGSLITSIARARLGRRRMKPRSSSAVIRRWIPDFERRSSASFISSKEGGTPDSFRRSLMNRRSSYCLRLSISINHQFAFPGLDGVVRFRDSNSEAPIRKLRSRSGVRDSRLETSTSETNHEQTLYVPYVFRNHLISRQRTRAFVGTGALGQTGRRRISHADPATAAGANGARNTNAPAAARFPNSEPS